MSTRTSISPHQKYSNPTSNRPHQKYSTDESIRRLMRCPNCYSIIEASTDDSSSSSIHSSTDGTISCPSYDVVFFMSFMHSAGKSDYCKDKKDIVRMYKIQIYPESRLEDESRVLKIRHLWEGLLPHRSSFAALDSNVYCLGGQKISPSTFVPYVYMLDTSPSSRCLPMPSMNFPRMEPQSLVLGGNVYVLSGDYGSFFGSEPTNRGEVEVYYPMDGRWDVLPDPPIPLEWKFICAALENPDRILVAPRTEPGKALFCIYDVGQGNWKLLDNPERKIHNLCPLGVGGALTVGSTIYWITENFMLLAYLLDEDMWLSRNLYRLQTSYFGYKEWGCPALLHLKDHKKICMVQSAPENMVICVILEVFENLSNKRLDVSVVSVQKFEAEMILPVKHCFLL